MGMHSPNDIGKPHCIVVSAQGERFANEATSYMEFGQLELLYAAGASSRLGIFDTNHRNTYIWGMLAPGMTPKALIESGYLKKADSLEAIARACSIDPAGLAQTVARFNVFTAERGVDEDFHRGESAYNRYSGRSNGEAHCLPRED